MAASYADFLARRAQLDNLGGFEPDDLPGHLFDQPIPDEPLFDMFEEAHRG